MTPTTLFSCHHPYARRRLYQVQNGATLAECQVCYSCGAVRTTTDGWWPHGSYLYRAGDLLEIDGRLRIRRYWNWYQHAPVTQERVTHAVS